MDFHALAGAVRPAHAEEAPLLREVLHLYGLALEGHFHLLPALQEKGRQLSPATLAALDRALRSTGRRGPGWECADAPVVARCPDRPRLRMGGGALGGQASAGR
jgi:hypothetical protein